MLESEKTTLNEFLEKVKAARDEAMTTVDSLRFECEKQIQVTKEEADEKMAKVVSKRDEVFGEGKS